MALARKLTTKIYEIQAHPQKVTCLDLGETGRVLVTGGQDRNVNLWAIGSDQCFNTLHGHNGQIECVKFAYTDNFVYSADEHGIIKRWDLNGSGASASNNGCTTFYGHMKAVRTLDFHPYGEYVASGSCDTTVRLWDVRKNNACIETYRGHIANVNSVRFSPDGSWIASAGTEGCLIIWDIRQRKKIIEFQEHASPITCIQFHPFEFLIAAGRNDGTVDLYDLEARKLIARTDANSAFSGHTVKCVAFSENGECLFVGTAEGISVIGWEPDREFDHIEGAWAILGDMKVLAKKVYCASYEQQTVKIHDVLIEKVIPFYNPNNHPFSYNQSSRRSFSRGSAPTAPASSGRLNLSKSSVSNSSPSSAGSPIKSSLASLLVDSSSPSSMSFDMIEEEDPAVILKNGFQFERYAAKRRSNSLFIGGETDGSGTSFSPVSDEPLPPPKGHTSYMDNYAGLGTSDLDYYPMRSGLGIGAGKSAVIVEPEREDFPIQSATPPDYAPKVDIVAHQKQQQQQQQHHQNQHHSQHHSHHQYSKHKSQSQSTPSPLGRRHSPPGLSTTSSSGGPRVAALTRKFAAHSMSTVDLHLASTAAGAGSSDESLPGHVNQAAPQRRGSATTATNGGGGLQRNYGSTYASTANLSTLNNNNNNNHGSSSNNVRMRRETTTTTTTHYNRENQMRSKKINVQIYESAKPQAPLRSKTSLDLRADRKFGSQHTNSPVATVAPTSPPSMKRRSHHYGGSAAHSNGSASSSTGMMSASDDAAAYAMLSGGGIGGGLDGAAVTEHLGRRLQTLRLLKQFARQADVVEALRHAIKINDAALLVDLFGIMLETQAVRWTLDMCAMLLPELYELVRSVNRFHISRACDTLRHILTKFLPVIQENSDPYGAPRSLGVDITAEERRKKCIECRTWLLHIKSLPAAQPSYDADDVELGRSAGSSSLQEVQNLIVDL